MRYDFECPNCKQPAIYTMPMSDISGFTAVCEKCGNPMQRIFNSVPVKFNGSGFHSTDYKPRKPVESSKDGYCSSKTHTNTTSAERHKILKDD